MYCTFTVIMFSSYLFCHFFWFSFDVRLLGLIFRCMYWSAYNFFCSLILGFVWCWFVYWYSQIWNWRLELRLSSFIYCVLCMCIEFCVSLNCVWSETWYVKKDGCAVIRHQKTRLGLLKFVLFKLLITFKNTLLSYNWCYFMLQLKAFMKRKIYGNPRR